MPDQPPDAPDGLSPGDAPSEEELAWALHRLAVRWAIDDVRVARSLRVAPGDLLALKHVAVDDGIGPSELAGRLGMSTGSVNALVNRLTAGGHLERQTHQHDARRITLHLTGGTSARLRQHYQARAVTHGLPGRELTPEDRRTILHFLDAQA